MCSTNLLSYFSITHIANIRKLLMSSLWVFEQTHWHTDTKQYRANNKQRLTRRDKAVQGSWRTYTQRQQVLLQRCAAPDHSQHITQSRQPCTRSSLEIYSLSTSFIETKPQRTIVVTNFNQRTHRSEQISTAITHTKLRSGKRGFV